MTVTRNGAAIYEFHGESEFESERVRFFDFLQKKIRQNMLDRGSS